MVNACSVLFTLEEAKEIEAFAKSNGTTFSAQVRQWTLERLEDEMDSLDLKLAIEEDDDERTNWDFVNHLQTFPSQG